jgi:hypothetical protein
MATTNHLASQTTWIDKPQGHSKQQTKAEEKIRFNKEWKMIKINTFKTNKEMVKDLSMTLFKSKDYQRLVLVFWKEKLWANN